MLESSKIKSHRADKVPQVIGITDPQHNLRQVGFLARKKSHEHGRFTGVCPQSRYGVWLPHLVPSPAGGLALQSLPEACPKQHLILKTWIFLYDYL